MYIRVFVYFGFDIGIKEYVKIVFKYFNFVVLRKMIIIIFNRGFVSECCKNKIKVIIVKVSW